MPGETNLDLLLKNMTPELNEGEYVFCTVKDISAIGYENIVATFREKEGITVVIHKHRADALGLTYHFIASWISLTVHSSLHAVGLTAAFSNALAAEKISCNVIAAYYHDHIFVAKDDAGKALGVLRKLSVSF